MSRDTRRARREELIARSEAHREEIARCLAAWEKPAERVQRAMNVASFLKQHAPKVMGIAAGLATLWAIRGGKNTPAAGTTGPQVPGDPLRLGGVLDRALDVARSVRAVRDSITGAREGEVND